MEGVKGVTVGVPVGGGLGVETGRRVRGRTEIGQLGERMAVDMEKRSRGEWEWEDEHEEEEKKKKGGSKERGRVGKDEFLSLWDLLFCLFAVWCVWYLWPF